MSASTSQSRAASKLCLECRLCCDGTLFHDVRLGPGDNPARLQAGGLRLKATARGTRFPQPCAALCADGKCRVYEDRPLQCHLFECGVFKQLMAAEITPAAATRLVRQARRRADRVRRLLRKLGEDAEQLSLSERFRRVRRRMESGVPDEQSSKLFADLALAVHELNLLTHSRFYTRSDGRPPG